MSGRGFIRWVVRAAALLVASCAASCAHEPPPATKIPDGPASALRGYASARYAEDSSWLCLPGRQDTCARDLPTIEVRADGSKVKVEDSRSPARDKVDCFYVYPTVDLSLGPANHTDFSDLRPMIRATRAQAARFRDVCRLFVPLYRQMTIGTYFRGEDTKKRYFEVAEADVYDAFLHYLHRWNQGRKIVLIGHSQGGEMVAHLLKRFFDYDPEMRAQLLLAMPIGWPLFTAFGKTTGGTFDNIPVCTGKTETGCFLTYRSFEEGEVAPTDHAAPVAGYESVCVNPAELSRGRGAKFSRTYLPDDDPGRADALYRDLYGGRCVRGEGGYRWLAVGEARAPGDARKSPIDLDAMMFHTALGLHILDLQFSQGDLMDLIEERSTALP